MSVEKPFQPTWTLKHRLMLLAVLVVTAPLWVPLWLFNLIAFQCRLFWCLCCKTESAWQRCAKNWLADKRVYGNARGPFFDEPLEHALTQSFVRYHPNARSFIVGKLHDPNPYIVAHALKCLIRYTPFDRQEIPVEALSRTEEVHWQPFGCIVETLPLNQCLEELIMTAEFSTSEDA